MKCQCGSTVEVEREKIGLQSCYACGLGVRKVSGIMVSQAQRPAFGADEADMAYDVLVVNTSEYFAVMRQHGIREYRIRR